MAVPTYTEDLTDIATGDEAAGWINFVTNQQGTPAYEDADYPYIQGSFAVTQDCAKTKTLGNLGYDHGSTISLPTDGAFLVWQSFSSPFALDDYAGTSTGNAGLAVLIGDDANNFDVWEVGGKDKSPMPYGGWQCHAVNTTVTRDAVGAGTKTIDRYCGAQVALTAYPSKGEVHQVDVMRFGRCSAIFELGEEGSFATIAGFAAVNDNQSNRWGLLQEVSGGYLWQGRMQLGSASNAVTMSDSNITIFVKWTPKVTENFNLIEVINIDSNIEMTGFTFQVLDVTTTSKGRFLMTDPATVVLDTCTFIDMDTFIFDSTGTVTIDGCVFRRCAQVTQGGASFDGCCFLNATSAVSLLVDDLDNIDNCDFTSDGSNHAIELTEDHAGGTYTLTGCTYIGYAGSDGDTGNEVIFNDSTGHVIINIVDGDVPTIRNGLGATTALPTSVSLTMTVKDEAGDPINGAFAYIDDNNITPFIMNTTTNALGVATVQHTGGAAPGSTWRVRIYGYKPYTQTVDIAGDDISIPVTLISDPQQT
jgi:hypothetical protein